MREAALQFQIVLLSYPIFISRLFYFEKKMSFLLFSLYTTFLLSSIRRIPVAIVTRLLVGRPSVHVSIPATVRVFVFCEGSWLVLWPSDLYRRIYPWGVKLPVKHSSPSSSNLKYEWSCISTLT